MTTRLFPADCPRCHYSGREIIRYRGRRVLRVMLAAFGSGVLVGAVVAALVR